MRRIGDDQPPAAAKATIDLLGLDQSHDIVERGLQLAKHRDRIIEALCCCEFRETMLEGAADKSGVARAGAIAGLALFQDHDAAPGVRQGEGGGEPGVAGPHDCDVGPRRQGYLS
jgi:hypothetical protein